MDSGSLRSEDFDLVRRLGVAQRSRRLSLEELSEAVGISPSLLSRRLQKLVAAGWVERHQEVTPRGRVVHYLPKARVSVQWVSPRNGIAVEWTLTGEMDWDFPLASQVPDPAARETIRRFLHLLRKGGRLDVEQHWSGDHAVQESSDPGVTVVVFGSSARGTATSESDVDLVVFTEKDGHEDEVLDVAAETSLHAPRSIQARVVPLSGAQQLPPAVRRALRADGLVVFDALQSPLVWQLVHGGDA